ncbi:hypothetical protein D3C73_1354930 [compost metagenome]
MYQVKIIEKICGQLAVNVYSFEDEEEMKLFVEMCREDRALVFVQNNKKCIGR